MDNVTVHEIHNEIEAQEELRKIIPAGKPLELFGLKIKAVDNQPIEVAMLVNDEKHALIMDNTPEAFTAFVQSLPVIESEQFLQEKDILDGMLGLVIQTHIISHLACMCDDTPVCETTNMMQSVIKGRLEELNDMDRDFMSMLKNGSSRNGRFPSQYVN